MTRTRLSLISAASILGAALPAFAQAPAPAPMYAPAPQPMYQPAPQPMMAPPPGPEAMPVMPAAPVMAPRAADDMTGSIGFGIGVGAALLPGGGPGTGTGTTTSTSLVTADTTMVEMKYWMSDAMAIVPRLNLQIGKVKDVDATWVFAPAVLADFTLLKGASTRLSAGAGLGLTLAKGRAPAAIGNTTDTYIGFNIPVQIGVEHFFARWFSMGLGTTFNFLNFAKQGTPWGLDVELSNIRYMGSLFFYTD